MTSYTLRAAVKTKRKWRALRNYSYRKHAAAALALTTLATPYFTACELLSGNSDDASAAMRISAIAGAIVFGGALNKGRTVKNRWFTSKMGKSLSDSVYWLTISAPVLPKYWMLGSSTDEAIWGLVAHAGFGIGGMVVSGSINWYETMLGAETYQSVPKVIRQASPLKRYVLAGGLTLAALAASAGMFATTDDKASLEGIINNVKHRTEDVRTYISNGANDVRSYFSEH